MLPGRVDGGARVKVLYATMQFGHGYGQGTERYLALLADGMRRRGHDAVVVACDPERRGPQLELGEPVPDDPRTLFCPTYGWMSVEGIPAERWRPVLERERPDVIHLANPAHIGVSVAAAARRLGLPVVVTVMDYWWLCPRHTLLHHSGRICSADVPWQECVRCIGATDARTAVRALARLPIVRGTVLPVLYFGRALARGSSMEEIGRWIHRRELLLAALDSADAVIFASRGAKEKLGSRLKYARICPVPYGLEARWFAARRERSRGSGPCDPARLTVGFAGALAPHKGPHLILEALHQLGWRSTRVRLAGGGAEPAYREHLQDLAQGLSVEFVGSVPSTDMPAFLQRVDLLVLPSIWPENLPIAMLEAQAVGVPVLASRIDGVTEAISDPAMLFDTNSAASLAERLARWAENPQGSEPVPRPSTADEMVERTLAVYEGVRGKRRG